LASLHGFSIKQQLLAADILTVLSTARDFLDTRASSQT
jgi:hypothetical protein